MQISATVFTFAIMYRGIWDGTDAYLNFWQRLKSEQAVHLIWLQYAISIQYFWHRHLTRMYDFTPTGHGVPNRTNNHKE